MKSSLKCVKKIHSNTTTLPPPPAKNCIINPDESEFFPDYPPFMVDSSDNLVVNNGTDYDRNITVAMGESLFLHCPGRTFENYPDDNKLEIRCEEAEGSKFQVISTAGSVEDNFSNLGCDRQYKEYFNKTNNQCGVSDEGELVEVGFQTETDGEFYWMFTSCHDKEKAHNLWVYHHVLGSVGSKDSNNDRPGFTKNGFYSGYDINGMYTKNSQLEVLTSLLGSDLAEIYLPGGDLYLVRGHLAPNADFMNYPWQDATFTYIDVAPQWGSFNGGNWLDVENGIRYLAEYFYGTLQVWTGTLGILQLEDEDGNLVDIYLDETGLEKIPVPKFFWKIAYDEKTKKGIAVVGTNNVHRTEEKICTPIEEVTWLKFLDTTDITSGPVYCCSVESFLSEADVDIGVELDVSGLLL